MIRFNDYRRFRIKMIGIDLETTGTIGNYVNRRLDYNDLEAILQKLDWWEMI